MSDKKNGTKELPAIVKRYVDELIKNKKNLEVHNERWPNMELFVRGSYSGSVESIEGFLRDLSRHFDLDFDLIQQEIDKKMRDTSQRAR